jgi:hypothetical protein
VRCYRTPVAIASRNSGVKCRKIAVILRNGGYFVWAVADFADNRADALFAIKWKPLS